MTTSDLISALAVFSLGLLSGCHDVTGPVPTGSRFVLTAVGGDFLPTTLTTGPDGTIAIADTLVFVAESARTGRVEHHQTIQNVLHTFQFVIEREYEWKDGVLTFHPPPCPPGAMCVRYVPETGRLSGGTLTISYDDPLVRPRTYQRLP